MWDSNPGSRPFAVASSEGSSVVKSGHDSNDGAATPGVVAATSTVMTAVVLEFPFGSGSKGGNFSFAPRHCCKATLSLERLV
jgi:hypothetical protein